MASTSTPPPSPSPTFTPFASFVDEHRASLSLDRHALASAEVAAAFDARPEALSHVRARFAIPSRRDVHPANKMKLKSAGGAADAADAADADADADATPSVYLCGNSLGLQPLRAARYVAEEMEVWARRGVQGHFLNPAERRAADNAGEGAPPPRRQWLTTDDFATPLMARVVGALPHEVALMNTLTCNLHLLCVPFYRPTATRHKLMIEARAFPSDTYAMESQVRLHGLDPATSLVQLRPDEAPERAGQLPLRTADIVAAIEREGDALALVMFSGVQYLTGQLFELRMIAEAAHRVGALVGFDLAHAVGNVPLELHAWNVDFAVWCSYKYLNAGPGGIGGAFVHERHTKKDAGGGGGDDAAAATGAALPQPGQLPLRRLAGWWGHEQSTRFDMDAPFAPIEGAYSFRLSNPSVLCTTTLLAALEEMDEAGGMVAMRRKSVLLTGYLEALLESELGAYRESESPSDEQRARGRVVIVTPRDPAQRGCQLTIRVNSSLDAHALESKMEERGVVLDVRKPNSLRVSPVPMYNSFADVLYFVATLKQVIEDHDDEKK